MLHIETETIQYYGKISMKYFNVLNFNFHFFPLSEDTKYDKKKKNFKIREVVEYKIFRLLIPLHGIYMCLKLILSKFYLRKCESYLQECGFIFVTTYFLLLKEFYIFQFEAAEYSHITSMIDDASINSPGIFGFSQRHTSVLL